MTLKHWNNETIVPADFHCQSIHTYQVH